MIYFGGHETFGLRYSWLSKGCAILTEYPNGEIFQSSDAMAKLGVGKNMVASIKYWLRACQVIEEDSYQLTDVGKLIFSPGGYDPYLEDEATLWLIHWLLASSQHAMTWYWFFNCCHSSQFSSQELYQLLERFLDSQYKVKLPSSNTLRRDISLLLRMYSQPTLDSTTLEESLDAPLSALNLITAVPEMKVYVSQPGASRNIPIDILGFIVLHIFKEQDITSIPIEQLMYGDKGAHPSPGSIFRFTEESFVANIENLAEKYDFLEIRETAGIHQVYKKKTAVEPISLLKEYYRSSLRRSKAA